MNTTRLSGHGKYSTVYHVVWVTKYRKPVLSPAKRKYLVKSFSVILASMPECEILEYNILADHVHLIMIIPPKYAVKEVIGRLKGISSSRLTKRYGGLKKFYWAKNMVWSPGYLVSTVGVGEDKIRSYVRNQ